MCVGDLSEGDFPKAGLASGDIERSREKVRGAEWVKSSGVVSKLVEVRDFPNQGVDSLAGTLRRSSGSLVDLDLSAIL